MTTTKMFHMKDVWKVYSAQLLSINSDWWGTYHNKLSDSKIYRKVNINGKEKVELVFSYDQFRQIIDEFFLGAKQAIIAGEAVNLGNNIGKICARRVERNHNNKQVNWGRTNLQPKVLNEKTGKMVPKKLIYFTDDDYCRIGLHKTGRIKNETVYEFVPTEMNKCGTGFKQELAAALKSNILLKFRYLYYPRGGRKQELRADTYDYNRQKSTV